MGVQDCNSAVSESSAISIIYFYRYTPTFFFLKVCDYFLQMETPCADPGILVRWVQAQRPGSSLDNIVFFSPQLILQLTEGGQWFYYIESYTFPRIQRGPTFSRGVQLFPGGGGGGEGCKC